MADKNWHASGTLLIPVQAVVCLVGTVGPARAFALSDNFAPPNSWGGSDANLIWEALLGGIVAFSFLVAIALWSYSVLQRAGHSRLRRNAFISSNRCVTSRMMAPTPARVPSLPRNGMIENSTEMRV